MSSAMRKVGVTPLLSAVTSQQSSSQFEPWSTNRTFDAYGSTASGSGSATIIIEARNDETSPYITLGTITLTLGVAATADGFASAAAWRYVRARLSAISGTGAAVTANCASAPL